LATWSGAFRPDRVAVGPATGSAIPSFVSGSAASVLDELRLVVFARGFASALTRQADDEGVLLVSAADLFA